MHYIYTGENELARRQKYASPTKDGAAKKGKYGNIMKLAKKGGLLKGIDRTPVVQKNSRFQGIPKGKGSKVYGIWERQGVKGKEGLKLLVAYTSFIKHKKFIDFFKVGEMVIKNNLHKEINKQFKRHLSRK